MKYLIIILMVLLMQNICAGCSEGQIDINSASLEELKNLTGVGLAIAQHIIDARPFESVDDLINAKQIGEGRLEKIKKEGLACVGDLDKNSNEDNKESDSDEDDKDSNNKEDKEKQNSKKDDEDNKEKSSDEEKSKEKYKNLVSPKEEEKEFVEEIQIETIKLNSKNIKTTDSTQNNGPEKNFAIYGLLSFCILLGFLFGIKKLKLKNYKNEFE